MAFMVASVLAALSGCSVDVVTTPTTSGIPSPASSAAPSTAGTQNGKDQTEAEAQASRSYWEPKVNVETACPGGSVVVTESGQVIKITTPCRRVTVDAPYVTVLAGDVGVFQATEDAGSGHFLIRKLDSATVLSSFSHLYWDQGTPKVSVSGLGTVARKNPTS